MLTDARARRVWNLYFIKAEAVLSPLAAQVRRELVGDLKTHVRDILANEPHSGDEVTRLKAALDRVGNPREFLAPLLAEAVFRAPPRLASAGMTMRTLLAYAERGTVYLLRALGLVLLAATGFSVAMASLNSLVRSDRAGLFLIGSDEYQLRLLGLSESTGHQLLEPWMAVLLILAGAAMILLALRRARRMLLELATQL
jgi:hypothetical protein